MDSERDILLEFLESDHDTDALATPEGLGAWLAERGLLEAGANVDDADVTRARRLRAALRSLVAAKGSDLDPRTVAAIATVTEHAPLVFSPTASGDIELTTAADGVAAAFVRVLVLVYRAQVEGRWERFKACGQCGYVFFDASKNRSRRWCDMASCGSIVESRSYRARQKARGEVRE
jgi:predicted RNA-binding Zn ribbon-like protein